MAAERLLKVAEDELPSALTDVRRRLQIAPSITAYSTAVLPDSERSSKALMDNLFLGLLSLSGSNA